MKFKYSAFIENTPEMREWLVKLGYKGHAGDHEFIIASDGHYSGTDLYMKVLYPCVNCYSNPSLFKAVTAIREDSDVHQIFFIEGLGDKDDYWVCDAEKFDPESENLPFEVYAYSKCDLSELQEHFKTK